MTENDSLESLDTAPGAEKPCLALMGEFSAGKSTLSNFLIGAKSLPVQVTATQLPPVWISHGDQPPYRVDLEGNVLPIDLNELCEIGVEDTAYIRIFREASILEMCDIIDMPGISDPSMTATVWQRVIHHATSVVWCTHANQAWRQSEAAVWDSLPPQLYDTSLLLITRFDKIISDVDREKLLRRVKRETEGLFADVLPISLLQAIEAGGDLETLKASGAQRFTERLVGLLTGTPVRTAAFADASDAGPELGVVEGTGGVPEPVTSVAAGSVQPKRVSPRTGIRPSSSRRSERPAPQAAHAR